jgi:hypothetical protein
MLLEKLPPPIIDGVTLLGIEIDFYCVIEDGSVDIGHLLLTSRDGKRECVLDTPVIRYNNENHHTKLEVDLEVMSNSFIASDFNNFTSDLWVENGFEVEPEHVTLFTRQMECTTAHDLDYE